MTNILKKDIRTSAGGLQLCAGQEGGSEAAIHAMVDIIRDEECEGLIQVDANNAFNTINRKVLLNNIYYLCPEIAIFTSNCYSIPARLFVVGGVEIESKEGTTQGDPIAMPIYAIGVRPLILALLEQATEPPPKTNESTVRLCAIADDLSGAGKLVSLRH